MRRKRGRKKVLACEQACVCVNVSPALTGKRCYQLIAQKQSTQVAVYSLILTDKLLVAMQMSTLLQLKTLNYWQQHQQQK